MPRRFFLWGKVWFIPENVRLQIRVGDSADNNRFAHQNVGNYSEILRSGRHNNANIRDYVEIDRMLRLIDPYAFKCGRETAGNTAHGNDAEIDARAKSCKRFNPSQRAKGNRDSVQAQVLKVGLRNRSGIARDFIDFKRVRRHGNDVARFITADRDKVVVTYFVAQGIIHRVIDGDRGAGAHCRFADGDQHPRYVPLKVKKQ